MNAFKSLSKIEMPKTQPLGMIRNNAGGLSFKVAPWDQLNRFLVLGTTGGTFYVGESDLATVNLSALEHCIDEDPQRAVDTICRVTKEGRAASKDPALFALAVAMARMTSEAVPGHPEKVVQVSSVASKLALARAFEVASTFTDFSHLLSFLRKAGRGFGSGLRRGLSRFYTDRPVGWLEYQLVKYWQRDGFSQQDAFRISHPASFMKQVEAARRLLWDYAAKKVVPNTDVLRAHGLNRLAAYGELQREGMTVTEAIQLVRENKLPIEAVPTHLRTSEMYETILFSEGNGMQWLVRNLANLAENGVLTSERPDVVKFVWNKFTDEDELKRWRMHPLMLLKALLMYKSGRSERQLPNGEFKVKEWPVVQRIVQGLDAAFRLSFRYAPASGKRLLLAVDVSGSMHGSGLSAFPSLELHSAAAIMALVVANVEPECTLVGFHGPRSTYNIPIDTGMTIEQVVREMRRQRGGSTALSDPVRWARENRKVVDGIVTFTDYETWADYRSPVEELNLYASAMGFRPKIVNVAMTANGVTGFGGDDPDLLECVGFDTNVPEAVSLFMTN